MKAKINTGVHPCPPHQHLVSRLANLSPTGSALQPQTSKPATSRWHFFRIRRPASFQPHQVTTTLADRRAEMSASAALLRQCLGVQSLVQNVTTQVRRMLTEGRAINKREEKYCPLNIAQDKLFTKCRASSARIRECICGAPPMLIVGSRNRPHLV